MVVHTLHRRVSEGIRPQNAVPVEFPRGHYCVYPDHHPLDCPVCDKGGECPLQDITMGWGPGKSRVIDEKRHFRKPIELSPLVAIDRERCILCYRCVRFSQEDFEDPVMQLHNRGRDVWNFRRTLPTSTAPAAATPPISARWVR